MNFGKWIVVAFVLFALFIATLVSICIKQDVNLVSKNYYKDELAYQDQITRLHNTAALKIKPEIRVQQDLVKINFPDLKQVEKGELKLFRPSDPSQDKSFEVTTSQAASESFHIEGLKKGMYRAQLQWTMGGKEYYIEEVIYI
jgi:hypothetical protein